MNYRASIEDFFKPEKWKTNLLLGAVCVLIPVVGQLVLAGWILTVLWSRGDHEDPAQAPLLDFQHFTKYLSRGLWPFLVQLATSLLIMPFVFILMFGILMAASANANGQELLGGLLIGGGILLYMAVILLANLIAIPLSISAIFAQDFFPAFRLGFVRQFIALMWREMVMVFLFLFGLGIALGLIMIVTCYIGGFLLMPVVIFSWHHLQKQLYLEFLQRGGEPLPRSQKLSDLPPALPTA